MSVPGYAGNILYVDLTTGTTKKEPLDPEWIRLFVGGWGISNRLAYDHIPVGVGPLAPENAIIIGTGPFASTMIPGSGKVFVTTKFPVNGAFATASGGGSFGLLLKSSGYDYVVITGRAETPVYLKILDDDVELCDAAGLWGKDNYDTIDDLRNKHEPCSVIPIGQAGEHLVKDSVTSVDKGGSIGRGGLPAIMGSKNLKALVAVQGSKGVVAADRVKLQKMVDGLIGRMMSWPTRESLLQGGMGVAPIEWYGLLPVMTKSYTEAHSLSEAERKRFMDFLDVYKESRKPLACPTCPLGDKEVCRIGEGAYQGAVSYGNAVTEGMCEFSTKAALWGLGRAMVYANTLNRYGLDTVNFGSMVSLALYLYERGILTKEDTGAIELKDDLDTVIELARMTAHREGFGDFLADGIEGFISKLGKGGEYACHIKGQSPFFVYDPRLMGFGTMEMTQITNLRGAHVAAGGSPSYMPGRPISDFSRHGERMGASEQAIERSVGPSSFNPGRYSVASEHWYSVFNLLGLCNRAMVNRFYHIETLAELYSAVTGIEKTAADLVKDAERAYNLGKMLNVRAGFSRKDDRPPEAWFKPLRAKDAQGKDIELRIRDYYSTTTLTREDIDRFLDDYYDERGWDKTSGTPTPEKLKELGLDSLAV